MPLALAADGGNIPGWVFVPQARMRAWAIIEREAEGDLSSVLRRPAGKCAGTCSCLSERHSRSTKTVPCVSGSNFQPLSPERKDMTDKRVKKKNGRFALFVAFLGLTAVVVVLTAIPLCSCSTCRYPSFHGNPCYCASLAKRLLRVVFEHNKSGSTSPCEAGEGTHSSSAR